MTTEFGSRNAEVGKTRSWEGRTVRRSEGLEVGLRQAQTRQSRNVEK
jgi:hypothetical protein